MPSNYTFCGYDMLSPQSKAGRSDTGINLNSVTAQYTLQNNPDLARSVFEGIIPSRFDNSPTVSDGGVVELQNPLEEKGAMSMNPMELAQATSPFPSMSFPGALGMYQDQFQPTAGIPQYTPSGMYGGYGYQYSPNGFMPISYIPPGQVPFNFSIADPSVAVGSQGFAGEWNEYQRQKGFRAPIPASTQFEDEGLLSGFHEGFDPHAAMGPQPDEFYDVSAGGRLTLGEQARQQMMQIASYTWGYQPGQLVERREIMMFPGINMNHGDPRPANEVTDYSGKPQRRLGNSGGSSIPSTSLPISNMVSTNPYMAGVTSVGGYNFGGMSNVPSPYMQARYNYAIHHGFQSIQEMDNSDFRVLKMLNRIANCDKSWGECEEIFEKRFCTPFEKPEVKKPSPAQQFGQEDKEIPRMKVAFVRGDEVLASCNMEDNNIYREHLHNVNLCIGCRKTDAQKAMEIATQESIRAAKDNMISLMYLRAPERKYDKKSMFEFMEHGFVESFMHLLNLQDELNRTNPNMIRQNQQINTTAFLRNTLERGMGILPAEVARIEAENKMFYKNEDLPDESLKGVKRGGYGVKPDGTPMNPEQAPMFGYTSYIPDPEHPERSIGFPRRFIEEVYEGYLRYCGSVNTHSKKTKIKPLDHDTFINELGVSIVDDDEFLKRFGHLEGTERFSEAAKRSLVSIGDSGADFLEDVPIAGIDYEE